MDAPQTRAFGSVKVGDELPPVTIALTHTGVTAAAIATRDFQPIHHDVERARALGSANVFINTYTTAGYLERLVVNLYGGAGEAAGTQFEPAGDVGLDVLEHFATPPALRALCAPRVRYTGWPRSGLRRGG